MDYLNENKNKRESFERKYFVDSNNDIYETLFNPVKDLIKGKNVIIVPDGILYYFPFEILVSDLDNNRYLIEDCNISYIQSATVLSEIRGNAKKIHTNDLLAFGDPYLGKADEPQETRNIWQVRSAETDTTRLDVAPLLYSQEEIENIAENFTAEKVKIYFGEDAKESVLKSEGLKDYQFIHFATHGVLNTTKPQFSGLVFSPEPKEDGFLQTFEIFNLNLNTDIAVLSACQTGLGKMVGGEGFVGLTRAFMYAGCRNLIVSLWSVADKSTAEFMTQFYKNITVGLDYKDALRKTKLYFISSQDYSSPFYWAPFILVGGG